MVRTGLWRPSPVPGQGQAAGGKGWDVGAAGRCGLRRQEAVRRRLGAVASAGLGEAGSAGQQAKAALERQGSSDDADGAVGVDEGGAEAVVVLAALAGLDGDDGIQALAGGEKGWGFGLGRGVLVGWGLVWMRGLVIGERRAGRGTGVARAPFAGCRRRRAADRATPQGIEDGGIVAG